MGVRLGIDEFNRLEFKGLNWNLKYALCACGERVSSESQRVREESEDIWGGVLAVHSV